MGLATRELTVSAPPSLALPQPYLLFLGDTVEPGYAKTAFGLRDWAAERCVGEFALPSAARHHGPAEAFAHRGAAKGAQALVIGVANSADLSRRAGSRHLSRRSTPGCTSSAECMRD